MERRLLLATTPVVIDLLAVYTPAAASAAATTDMGGAGGDGAILRRIQGSVDEMNRALVNSLVSVTIRLVHAESISYSGSGDLYTDRIHLENQSDGVMDSIGVLRSQYGADLVTLITDGNVAGGNASLMTELHPTTYNNDTLAYSAIAESSIGPGYLTLAHELGHNLGAGHERGNPTENVVGPFDYSYGYRYVVNDAEHTNVSYNDIMSYAYGSDYPIAYYANPNVIVQGGATGVPIGQPTEADLDSTFAQTAPIVAAYRGTVVPDTAAPTASLFQINRTGASLDFTVRYLDDSGIDLSSIDSNDVTVSGPGGWVLPAQFVSYDHPAVAGAFKEATYHVTLPATNPSTDSLVFTLKPNAVRDLSNHYAAAGILAGNVAHTEGDKESLSRDLGSIAPGTTRTEFGLREPVGGDHVFEIHLASAATLSVALTGLTADLNFYVFQDTNKDGQYAGSSERKFESFQTGTTRDASGALLAAGTYYIVVYPPSASITSPFTLAISAYTDTVAPTATLLASDMKTNGAANLIFAVTYSDDHEVDGSTARYNSTLDVSVVFDGNFTGFYNGLYPDLPVAQGGLGLNDSVDFANAGSKTLYYVISAWNTSTGWTPDYNSTWTVSIHPYASTDPHVHDASSHDLPVTTIGTFRIAIAQADATAPTATLQATPPVAGQTAWDFNVIYNDNVALDTNTFDGNDIRVTGPGGFNQLATKQSVTPAIAGAGQIVTYRVTATGGFWDGSDDGTYTIALQSGQVRDSSTNPVAAGTLGSFITSMQNLVSQGGGNIAFNGTNAGDVMRFDGDANFVYFGLNDTTLWYLPASSVTRAVISSLAGDDAIDVQSGTFTGSLAGGSGMNKLNVTGGKLTLDSDAGSGATALAANVGAGATLNFTAATEHLAGFNLAGNTQLPVGGNKVLITTSLSITGSGQLDLADNDLVLDYSTMGPQAYWNGAAYTSLPGLVVAGRNGGAWNGGGIISSAATLNANLKNLASDEAAAALKINPGQTQLFSGQTVDATAVLIKFTWGGDANFDGKLNIDDYIRIDTGFASHLTGWSNGDFNYDGKVNIDDYIILDANLPAQTGVL